MKYYSCIKTLLFSMLVSSYAYAESPIVIKHYQQHDRYDFGIKVLDLAMSKLGEHYEIIGPETSAINEARGERLVINGDLDIEFLSTTWQRESSMIPIKIPIYRGMLGLRLLLVKPESNSKFEHVEDLLTFRQFTGGHGAHWGDLPVYKENNLKVITRVNYDDIFKMLKKGRFDYFHRGVTEIWEELARYQSDFVIADNIMLYYPHPVYFFVGKHRPALAFKIKKGLTMALADGSFEELFQTYFKETILRSNLADRHLIVLKNPVNPSGTPPVDTSWWMPSDKWPQK